MDNIVKVPIGPIKKNRAQMRRVYDVRKLAELTLQMISRGFDPDKPILIRQFDDGYYEYENIRGHRRRMAFLISCKLLADANGQGEWTIESTQEALEQLLGEFDGDVEAVAESLTDEFGNQEVPAVIFEGDAKQAVLALWSDNYGDEDPDPLGVAHSLMEGIKLGIKPAEAEGHMGQSSNFIRNHLALAQVDPEIAKRITKEGMSISIAPMLIDLPEAQRAAVTKFILMTPVQTITVAKVKNLTRLLGKVDFSMPLTFPTAVRRNVARAFINLWTQKLEEDPVRAWLGACIVLYPAESFVPPWEDSTAAQKWVQALDSAASGHWMANIEPYLTEVSCETCPIAQLPDELLKLDLVQPKLPCRSGIEADKCLYGLAPQDPFHARVPMAWGEHTGVKREGSIYFCDSYDDLLAAWEAQKKQEAKEAKAEKQRQKREKKAQEKTKKGKATSSDAPAAPPAPSGPSPIELMRAQIRMYMAQGETAVHFLDTPCSGCQHKLDSSPTSDPAVPHCAWASHKRNIEFRTVKPAQAGPLKPFDVCRQYAPAAPWRELIPEFPDPPVLPRPWLEAQIIALVKDRKGSSGYKPFQWLTGRPMTSNGRYDDWFIEQFAAQKESLSDAQMFSLFTLALGEWKRTYQWGENKGFFIPLDESFSQMIEVTEEKRDYSE